MKTIRINYFLLAIICPVVAACGSYLDSDSADLQIPESVNDYAPLLWGEGYPDNFGSQLSFSSLFTDDVEMGPLLYPVNESRDAVIYNYYHRDGIEFNAGYGQFAHIWAQDYLSYLSDTFWRGRYRNILACNAVIEALPTMSYTESEKGIYNKLAMQAYALRAYHYFCLINTYALPYSESNLNEPGVILNTASDIGISGQPRSTIQEIYDLINSDITKALQYSDGANNQASKFEITKAAVCFLAARIALFQNQWDEAIKASEDFLKLNKSIFDLNTANIETMGRVYSSNSDVFLANDITHNEVVFAFGKGDSYARAIGNLAPQSPRVYYDYGFHTSWSGENSLISLYESDDLRLKAYFMTPYHKESSSSIYAGQYHPYKNSDNASTTTNSSQAWRTPEIYLTIAEAYARKEDGISQIAIDYINQLREKKFLTGSSQTHISADDFSSKQQFIQFIWQERRRELCFEELMRFWDMRRQGMPEQTHYYYSDVEQYQVYQLPQGSRNYVLRIPDDEVLYNTDLVNNEWDIIGR